MRSRQLVLPLVTAGLTIVAATARGTSMQPTCFVNAIQGAIQGVDRGASCSFQGIPFAAAPLNALRWKAPQPGPTWSTTFPANVAPPSCPNVNSGAPGGNEDCLKLNIWAPHPRGGPALPVIVWLHGGSFIVASAGAGQTNGTKGMQKVRSEPEACVNYTEDTSTNACFQTAVVHRGISHFGQATCTHGVVDLHLHNTI